MQGKQPVTPPFGFSDPVVLPVASVEIPPPPDYLKGRARVVWETAVKEMVTRQIYDTDCRELLAAYCVQMARFLDAEDEIATEGTIVKQTKTVGRGEDKKEITERVPNNKIQVSNHACDRACKLAEQLGLTPIARKRVVKVRDNAVKAPATRFLRSA